MKKFFIILLILVTCFALGACYIISHTVQSENTLNTFVEPANITENTINNLDDIKTNALSNELTNESDSNTIFSPQTEIPDIVAPPKLLENGFELPLNGASGYTSISLKMYNTASTSGTVTKTLNPGTGFKVLQEQDNWW